MQRIEEKEPAGAGPLPWQDSAGELCLTHGLNRVCSSAIRRESSRCPIMEDFGMNEPPVESIAKG